MFQDRLRTLSDIGNDELTLSVSGAPLEDDLLVSELASTELDLTVPLLGGKVHGSLARAGEYMLMTSYCLFFKKLKDDMI